MPSAYPLHITLGKGATPPLHPCWERLRVPIFTIQGYVVMTDTQTSRVKKPAPWRGRRRVPDPKDSFISVRCTAEDHAEIDEQATKAGLSKGAYLRALALGGP